MDGPFWLSYPSSPRPWVCAKQTEGYFTAWKGIRNHTITSLPRLGDNSSKGGEKLERNHCGHHSESQLCHEDRSLVTHIPCMWWEQLISPRKTALTLTRGEHIHRAQHSPCPGGVLAVIQTATGVLKTVTAILSSPEQN